MKAQSFGRYDVFDDETALTWEQAEALAQRARGKDVPVPPTPEKVEVITELPASAVASLPMVEVPMGPPTKDRDLLNRALILLIHLRERVFKEDPQIETWVNELLTEAKQ